MNEAARLIGMLRASAAAHKADFNKPIDNGYPTCWTDNEASKLKDTKANEVKPLRSKGIPVSFLESLIHATKHSLPYPEEEDSDEVKGWIVSIIETLDKLTAKDDAASVPRKRGQDSDLVNDLAILTCKRIFNARLDPIKLKKIANNLGVAPLSPDMAGRFPVLSTSNLPRATAEEQAATQSPARGTAMLNSIFKSVRVPEFRHKWMFWAEKGQQSTPKDKAANSEEYASRPKPLGEQIISVKEFYQHFNNIPVESLKLRDSIHLFHLGVKPLWEDPRNARGGAWYFKISKEIAAQFWHEMCLLAVGDKLQSAIETKRESFNDDICGISYSVRWNAVQIAVWNRDADNEAGREKLLAVILDNLSAELQPKKEETYWYKAHKEHKGFIEQQ